MTCTLWSSTSPGQNVHPVQLLDTVEVRWIVLHDQRHIAIDEYFEWVISYCVPKVLLNIVTTGGDAVLLYASIYHDLCTVVYVSGRYDLKRGIEEHYGKDFMEVIKKEGFIDVKNKSGNLIILFSFFPFMFSNMRTQHT